MCVVGGIKQIEIELSVWPLPTLTCALSASPCLWSDEAESTSGRCVSKCQSLRPPKTPAAALPAGVAGRGRREQGEQLPLLVAFLFFTQLPRLIPDQFKFATSVLLSGASRLLLLDMGVTRYLTLSLPLLSHIPPQSSHLAEPLWTDFGIKSGISVREIISS